MSDKNYFELQEELEQLLDAFDEETNPDTRTTIEGHIDDVKQLIADYDLSDDDLFECVVCKRVTDIEESEQKPHGLVCENCA